jgi:sensor histidine kinase YesM
LLETLLSVLFFYAWITVAEWLQKLFFNRFGEGFLIEFKIPAQLATLAIASALAVVFNIGFFFIWRSLDATLENRFGVYREQEARLARPALAASLEERRKRGDQRRRTNNGLTVMAMLSAFYLAANRRAYRRLEDVQLRAERLEKENVQAQFAALKSQVNPHFLFNSLSILSSLVHADAELSEKFIDQLSRAYRYILEQKDNERVLLKTELEFIQAYRFLLNIRFENKFDVVVNVPEADQNRYSIAPLTLQLLVENAVKHNRMSVKEPLRVNISIDNNTLQVSNNRQLRPQSEASTGVGLQNIINRYALLTERPVWIGENEGNFVVKIPLLGERVKE